MSLSRREFLYVLSVAAGAGLLPLRGRAATATDIYEIPKFGNMRLLHITDTHAQLMPVYFREPNVNIGLHDARGRPPHLVGTHLLEHYDVTTGTPRAYAFTYLDFAAAAERYGKLGGYAHVATLVKRLRAQAGAGASLLLDGGDTWQGSGTAYKTRGKDMVGASNQLGVDLMTGHWEFTYPDQEVLENLKAFKGEFIAQNIKVREEALFEGVEAYDEDTGHAFKPYVMRELGGARLAVIGQAFPYTPIANPSRFVPNWTFGINPGDLQRLIERIREQEKPDAVILLSHNGMDVDAKLAAETSGLDAILGGHTHDVVPQPMLVKNRSGQTLVTNAGSNGKFVAVLDLDAKDGKVRGFRYHLLPVFANLLPADADMARYIDQVRKPHLPWLNEKLAVAGDLLYRRGNFNGSFDQLICDALIKVNDAEIALSPGFRWGTSVLPGQPILMEHVLDQTAITYPETYRREMAGAELKAILEDVADNLFNPDPYYQQGGDMVRVGGLDYTCDPKAAAGERITDMRRNDGKPIEAAKKYVVTGWATVGAPSPGRPVWDVVADYLRAHKDAVRIERLNTPQLKDIAGNPGIADYPKA